MLKTEPKKIQNRVGFFLTVLIFTAIGFIAVSMLGLFLQFQLAGPTYQLPKYLVVPLLLVETIPGFLVGFWIAKKMLNKQRWELTDTELKCGSSGQQVFRLSSIEKIIIGRPTGLIGNILQRDKPGTVTGTTLNVLATLDGNVNVIRQVNLAKKNSIIVCFDDGSWLPLCLDLIPNGTSITNELKERFKDRLVHNYNFSPEEIRRLRTRDINELIPKV